jgi:hypothetical protein
MDPTPDRMSSPSTPERALQDVLLDATDARPVHFVGIAGAGMSALAELLARRGVRIQGTDANPGGAPDLARYGIRKCRPRVPPVYRWCAAPRRLRRP